MCGQVSRSRSACRDSPFALLAAALGVDEDEQRVSVWHRADLFGRRTRVDVSRPSGVGCECSCSGLHGNVATATLKGQGSPAHFCTELHYEQIGGTIQWNIAGAEYTVRMSSAHYGMDLTFVTGKVNDNDKWSCELNHKGANRDSWSVF